MTKTQAALLGTGTLLECNTEGIYDITKPGVICSYVKHYDGHAFGFDMLIQVEQGQYKGHHFPVNSMYFDIVNTLTPPDETEIFALL